ncbi:hypothetical protein RYX36_034295 [Vicia faba]
MIVAEFLGGLNERVEKINNLSLKDKFLLDELKWIQWQGCPLKFIPLDTLPHELAVLDLSNAEKIKSLPGLESHNNVRALKIRTFVMLGHGFKPVVPSFSALCACKFQR